jgi:hypothetical protein
MIGIETGCDRRLGVERVEDRLDQQDVDAAPHEGARLLRVGGVQCVEVEIAIRGVVHVG